MEIVSGRRYRVVVRFPWGERREADIHEPKRDEDGTVHWTCDEALGVEPYLDMVIAESDHWVHGWAGGCCDVTAVISWGPDAPEP